MFWNNKDERDKDKEIRDLRATMWDMEESYGYLHQRAGEAETAKKKMELLRSKEGMEAKAAAVADEVEDIFARSHDSVKSRKNVVKHIVLKAIQQMLSGE